ncbi:cell wall metabolism sensor histidine kinase WalK [Crassaminicella thermophila]|uniref:Cell wall metabolism sensor histidine kinase WalK n=1 Tax=Crassaminicella thermophila TaxID=2599308 RepID=A0A5C0SET3_CRATE|nr:cell wall metabolism sensor histidine kinase WalK [Crassaminicella thermophila]QEK12953.1 cell wall metabolism sensor histidine kinase WalK [Crassaminicella thermophila]
MNFENNFNRNQWIDFVRNLKLTQYHKLNTSTFGLAGILIFIAVTSNKLVINFPKYQSKIIILTLFYATIYHFLDLVVFKAFNFIFRRNTIMDIAKNKFTDLDKQCYLFGYLTEILFAGLALIANIIIFYNSSTYDINSFPYKYFSIIYFICFLTRLRILYNNYFKKNIALINNQVKKRIKIIFYIVYVPFFLYFPYPLYVSLSQVFIHNNLLYANYELFLYAIYILLILGSLQLIALHMSNRIKYSWLENFEKDIFINNLTSEQIKYRLKNEFLNSINIEWFYYNTKNN